MMKGIKGILMNDLDTNPMNPHKPTHPGELLRQEIEARKIDIADLCISINIGFLGLIEIISGKKDIDQKTAEKLEKELGIPADYWLRMQKQYNSDMEKQKTKQSFSQSVKKAIKQLNKASEQISKAAIALGKLDPYQLGKIIAQEIDQEKDRFSKEVYVIDANVERTDPRKAYIEKEPTKPELKEGEFYYAWDKGSECPVFIKVDRVINSKRIECTSNGMWKIEINTEDYDFIVPATEANLKKYFG